MKHHWAIPATKRSNENAIVHYSKSTPSGNEVLFFHFTQPLIAYLAWAEVIYSIDQPIELFQNLVHEMQYFQLQLKPYYPVPTLKIASYLLCIALDALIVAPLNKKQKDLHLQSLLYYFHQDLEGKKRFMKIIEVLLHNKNLPQELSILTYFCVTLGDQGQHFGPIHLRYNNMLYRLYHLIESRSYKSLIHTPQNERFALLKDEIKIDRLLMWVCFITLLTLCIWYSFCTVNLYYYTHEILKLY